MFGYLKSNLAKNFRIRMGRQGVARVVTGDDGAVADVSWYKGLSGGAAAAARHGFLSFRPGRRKVSC